MVAMRKAALDEVGDLSAPPGSRAWAVAILSRMRAALKDERMNARHLEQWRNRFIEYRGFQSLTNERDEPFPTFEAFCRAPEPYGLGYSPDAIDAIIAERKSAEARAAAPKEIAQHGEIGRGRNRGSDATSIGRGADYLTARIARDRPDVLARMRAGEFPSVAAAARAAGIVTAERKSVRIDDPDKVSEFLARHFDVAEIRAIADLAVHLREGGEA